MAPEDGLDRTELIRKADIALYKAKMAGRGRYLFFTPSMDEDIRLREAINRELREALADRDRQLKLLYQPIYSAASGRIVAVEALLRWDHPENGLVMSDSFIRSAEESGQIEVLGTWVLRKAMQDAQRWPDLRIPGAALVEAIVGMARPTVCPYRGRRGNRSPAHLAAAGRLP